MVKIKTLCPLLILFCIFTVSSAAQGRTNPNLSPGIAEINPATKRFESKAGNFSISITEAPNRTRDLDAEKGQDPGKQFFWQFEKTVYTVMYSAFNENDLSRAFDDMNSGSRKSVRQQGGRLISEKEITYDKYQGKEFRYFMPNGYNFILRNYLVKNVGYLLTATYIDGNDEKEVLEILDSFKLLIEKK